MDRNFKYVRQIGRWTLHTFEECNIKQGLFPKKGGMGQGVFSKNIRGYPSFCVKMHAIFGILREAYKISSENVPYRGGVQELKNVG